MPVLMGAFDFSFFLVTYCPVVKGLSLHDVKGACAGMVWCQCLHLQLSFNCLVRQG